MQILMSKTKFLFFAPSLNVVYDVMLSITSVSTPPLNVHAKYRLI